MALAAVITDRPRQHASAALLGIDMATIEALASAADDVDTPKGRRLVRALSTANNTLRDECRAVYGKRQLKYSDHETCTCSAACQPALTTSHATWKGCSRQQV